MSDPSGQPDLKTFPTGAVRSKDAEAVDYTLVSPIGLRAWAEACREGAIKYKPLYSAEKGLPARDLLNHAVKHIYDFLEGRRDEPDLGHALWNVGMAIHSLQMWPHLNVDLRRKVGDQLCVPPSVDDETAASWARFREQTGEMRDEAKATRCRAEIREGDFVTVTPDGELKVVRVVKEGGP